MKVGRKKYKIFVTPLHYDKTAPRTKQIAELCGAYVAELEKRLTEHPEQWYNFYDFWN